MQIYNSAKRFVFRFFGFDGNFGRFSGFLIGSNVPIFKVLSLSFFFFCFLPFLRIHHALNLACLYDVSKSLYPDLFISEFFKSFFFFSKSVFFFQRVFFFFFSFHRCTHTKKITYYFKSIISRLPFGNYVNENAANYRLHQHNFEELILKRINSQMGFYQIVKS